MSMIGAYKKFDKNLYEANDHAKNKAIKYFNRIGMEAIVNPDQYGIDLIVDNKFYCEVEVKHNWKGSKFPFYTLQLSDRKRKFAIQDSDEYPVIFMVINSEHTHALVAKGRDVISSPCEEVSNKYIQKGEYFFQIPIKKTVKVKL